ncbi:MAG TPA: amidinotransferase [Chitinophagaceae bacterium]|nr:amidinotransferase [Chitinophagaceae bacterium]
MQNTSKVLMIRPLHFGYNAETAVNNSFQVKGDSENLAEKAVQEFDLFVAALKNEGIDVTVVEDSPDPHTPDAIFPNNWISFHESGIYCLYPMFAPNRRKERKAEVLDVIQNKFHYHQLLDFTGYESENRFLEGTGSMVLDREKHLAYACLSPRTDIGVLEDFCKKMNYRPVVFHSTDESGQAIYHTNVMMCVADRYVVICLDSITEPEEKKFVTDTIRTSGKEIVPISTGQMNHFAGNMLQLENNRGEKILVMSSAAWDSLSPAQKEKLTKYNRILHASLKNIETNGGGSARCMIAEIHL